MLRKRSSDHLEEDERDPKRLKTGSLTLALDSLPDDCLCEILRHLNQFPFCAASLVCRRFNSIADVLILTEMLKNATYVNSMAPAIKKKIVDILCPRAHYHALESIATANNNYQRDEKLLSQLRHWLFRKIQERKSTRLMIHSPELWKLISGRYVYTEFTPSKTFTLRRNELDTTQGETVHASFVLFGQKGHFVEVLCDAYSYCEHMEPNSACELTVNATLRSYASTESLTVNGLLEGHPACCVPQSEDLEQLKNLVLEEDDLWIKLIEDCENGDRVMARWSSKYFPKVHKNKLSLVIEWLGWHVSTTDFANIIVSLMADSRLDDKNNLPDHALSDREREEYDENSPQPEVKPPSPDTSDTKASLESILRLMLAEPEDKWLGLVEQTVTLLEAKVQLINRINKQWKDKDALILKQAIALVERSMYTGWGHKEGQFHSVESIQDEEESYTYYKEVTGEMKLIAKNPSKWISFEFNVYWHRDNPNVHSAEKDEAEYSYYLQSQTRYSHQGHYVGMPWKITDGHIELVKSELSLDNFSADDVSELLGLIADYSHVDKSAFKNEFKKDVKNGDRIKVYWYHKCYPKLNHEKLTQVLEWLTWKMTTIEFAKLVVDQCLRPNIPPSRPAHYKDTNTRDSKASLQVITKLVLEDEDESFDLGHPTLHKDIHA